MPSFITSEMEKANLKFIALVKKHPCIWNRDAPNYNQKTEMNKAWKEISKEVGDTPKICLTHWQKIRRAYSRSFRLNAKGSYQKSEYYLSNALQFVRPHVKLGCSLVAESCYKDKVINDADDSGTSMTEIEIKDEPDDSDGGDTAISPITNAENVLFDIIKMEDDTEIEDQNPQLKSEKANSSCNKCKNENNENNSNEVSKTKESKEADKDVHPDLCLIDANRKFFESLIPFIDDMTNQQNRRFRREIMCLIDDVLDDRDIEGAN